MRLGAARASAPDTASLLRCLLDYVVNPFEESCVAACRLVLALHRVSMHHGRASQQRCWQVVSQACCVQAAQDAVPPLAAMLQQHANVRPLGETLVRYDMRTDAAGPTFVLLVHTMTACPSDRCSIAFLCALPPSPSRAGFAFSI